MKKLLMAAALSLPFLTGCSYRFADMTIASSKNYDINGGKFISGKRVNARDMTPVFIFPLGRPNLKEALDKAIEQDKCAVGLSDVTVTRLDYFVILFGEIGYEVEGNLTIDTNKPGCANRSPEIKHISPMKQS